AEFERLADEAEYFAANTDAIGERAPYYDPHSAAVDGKSALAIAEKWGPHAAKFALDENRAQVAQEEYELLLRMALVTLGQNQSPEAAREALALIDRAKGMGQPSHEYYHLRSQGLRLIGDNKAADDADVAAGRADTPLTPEDRFLRGEQLRLMDAGHAAED